MLASGGKNPKLAKACIELANAYCGLKDKNDFVKCVYLYRLACLHIQPCGDVCPKESLEYVYYKLAKLLARHKHYQQAYAHVLLAREHTKHVHFAQYLDRISSKLKTGNDHSYDTVAVSLNENLELVSHPYRGRSIKTKTDLANWTCVVQERAVSVIYNSPYLLTHCVECLRVLDCVLYPCRQCSQVAFCSKACENDSNTRGFHQYECGWIDTLVTNPGAWHAFRLISSIGLKPIVEFYKHKQSNDYQIEDYIKHGQLKDKDFCSMEPREKMEMFAMIDSLLSHGEKKTPKERNHAYRWAITIIGLTSKATRLSAADWSMLVHKVVLLIWKIELNSFACIEVRTKKNLEEISTGSALCVVSCMFNHDCDANTHWNIHEGIMTITTTRQIDSKQEVTVSYGSYADVEDIATRVSQLERYHFGCSCARCLQEASECKWTLTCLYCGHGPLVCTSTTVVCLCCEQAHTHHDELTLLTSLRTEVRRCVLDKLKPLLYN